MKRLMISSFVIFAVVVLSGCVDCLSPTGQCPPTDEEYEQRRKAQEQCEDDEYLEGSYETGNWTCVPYDQQTPSESIDGLDNE